jgi:hypothetical protein
MVLALDCSTVFYKAPFGIDIVVRHRLPIRSEIYVPYGRYVCAIFSGSAKQSRDLPFRDVNGAKAKGFSMSTAASWINVLRGLPISNCQCTSSELAPGPENTSLARNYQWRRRNYQYPNRRN